MKNKVTLITPPDFFENNNKSILLINLNEKDQETITNWLSLSESEDNLNIYFYSGENESKWLLYALANVDKTFIDIDNHCNLSSLFCSYILSKNEVYYTTHDRSIAEIYQYINTNRVPDIDYFLENILGQFLEPNK